MDNKQVTQSYIYKNTDNNLVKRPIEIFGPTSTEVQLGNDGSTTVIKGVSVYIDTSNFWIKDKLITLNKIGPAASGYSCGFEISENSVITGYFKVNTTRDGWLLKAPNSFEATISTSQLLANRTFTLPDASGALMIGNGTDKQLAVWSGSSNISALGAMINGQIVIGKTNDNPVVTTITQGSANQVIVTNGPGSITLSLPQDIDTSSTPSFYDLQLHGITSLLTTLSLYSTTAQMNSAISAALAPYLTSSVAAATYATIASLSGYATTGDLSAYLTLANAAATYATITSLAGYATTGALSTHAGLTSTDAHGATFYPPTANSIVARGSNNEIHIGDLNLISGGKINTVLSPGIIGLHHTNTAFLFGINTGFFDQGGGIISGRPLYNIDSNYIQFVSLRYFYGGKWHIYGGTIDMYATYGQTNFYASLGFAPDTAIWYYIYYNII